MQDSGVKPPVRSEDGIFLRPNMESSVLISEQEQQLLTDQRASISRIDRRRAKTDREQRESYASWEKSIIANNYKQFKGVAEGEKSRHPSSGEKAVERIQRIEKMKADILRFERYYDESSEEVKSLLSSLEDYYGELEADTYTANSFSGELIVRGLDYNAARDGWSVTVYSELFGLASLFKFGGLVEYKELIKKGGTLQGLQGLKALGGNEKDTSIHVIDSLFARSVPVLSATLEYKVVRGANASQYRFIPLSLTLVRTDTLKPVFSAGRSSLSQSFFFMTPQLAVASFSDMAITASEVQGSIEKAEGRGKKKEAKGKKKNGKTEAIKKEKGKEKTEGKKEERKEKRKTSTESHSYEGTSPSGNSFVSKMLEKQKRRRLFSITADTAVYDFANYDIKDLDLNSVKLNFDFAMNDYLFFGGGLAWRYAGRNSESFYGAFANGGANITLFRNFRPYVQLEVSANTGAELGLGFGGGIDFTIKHLLLNLNAGYNWSFDADNKTGDKSSTFASFGFGIGFTW